MINSRRRNRELITRLFQGFVDNYGESAGKKIIDHIVNHAGGQRIRIPGNNLDPLYGCSACFRSLWRTTCSEFGQASGRAIMKKIVVEFSGRRIYFPGLDYLYRTERNNKICGLYDGKNHGELALRFKLSSNQILNIVNSDD